MSIMEVGEQTHLTPREQIGPYQRLCRIVDVEPLRQAVNLDRFSDDLHLSETSPGDRLTAALGVLLQLLEDSEPGEQRIDKTLVDALIASLDERIGRQLDEVLHHPEFQALESAWRSLQFLLDRCDRRANVKVELMDLSKEALLEDFEDAPDTVRSGLYRQLYTQEYDTPGGEPVSTIIADYHFDNTARDIGLLREISRVCAACHCPFIGAVGPAFFGKTQTSDLPRIQDLSNYMEQAAFIRWNAFRETQDARYVGLTLPRFLLRPPWGNDRPARGLCYREDVSGEDAGKYLWGNAAFAFGANMAESFRLHGWAVNIRGPESGGRVSDLPLHQVDLGHGLQTRMPTEFLISETRELEYAKLGFIPLSYYKNRDFACFFSANSVQKPMEYSGAQATANCRINARLPYVFLVSRISHYLKILQRENIGAAKSRQTLEDELNQWLQGLVTRMRNPDPALVATHPLRDGRVTVEEIPENPGFYAVTLQVMPHFQIEGVDVRLSLLARMPRSRD
ncbi:type VI secretion system contractile sheath large subunit [Ectothiorhodospira lacustris]|uniref:type VI secretion system contractile sheath large subunit n=1 Tax=Ectothiorhodospira lacustris TaxID=2899127 RepID=UPI001EE88E97|nr:type VI secretion system contractile sheath large subunit [Ectothiorhodospira lacustris]MCG5509250.1 type VI secretion system contractile sheath large subunit [Ectothiorhodospira lacustris]MCG5521040.1 type VI secretion system contractile sheath large subunit [Ectothiorhodospira lacustris]